MAAGDEISFLIRSPVDAIKADMQAAAQIVDDTIKTISGKTAQIKIELDQSSVSQVKAEVSRIQDSIKTATAGGGGGGTATASADIGGGGGGGNSLVNSFIGFRATVRAVELAVHGAEAAMASFKIMTADTATEGQKVVHNMDQLVNAARELPVIGNLLSGPIRQVEEAAKAAKKALEDEQHYARHTAFEHEQDRYNVEAEAEWKTLELREGMLGAAAAARLRAEKDFQKTVGDAEQNFQRGRLSGEDKDALIKTATAAHARDLEKIDADAAYNIDRERKKVEDDFNQYSLEAAGKTYEADKAKFVASWEDRIEEVKHKGGLSADDIDKLFKARDFAIAAFESKQKAKIEGEEVSIEEQADEMARRQQEKDSRIQLQQSKFEERRINQGETKLARIMEARANAKFEAVLGSQTNLHGAAGGATIEDSVEVEKQIRDEIKLLTGKPPIVLKVF